MSDLSEKLRELVNTQLMGDETVQWVDQPIPVFWSEFMRLFVPGIYVIQLVVVFLLFAANGHEVVFWDNLLGISGTCLLVPVSCMIGAWIGIRERCRRTVYALTNHRAIIVYGTVFAFYVASYYPANLWQLSCRQKANGTGSLYFNTTRRFFLNIRNVAKVERMLQELKRTNSPERPC